ncbi:hypothetical protein [Nocardia sp. NRRL S-836]|uniref:nSTAND1 domain-containing NTPase n=1 Tax=Nocardia sp. NRRL S-836 TaxID=1519492 RepID=UPI0006AD942E|nr:hypothetical protein [Nocardia sp. NRRL S-836]
MPRAERPLEAVDTELGRFAADLRRLRDEAGKPAYRALAARAHYSAATLSDAAGGRKLPSLAVALAYVKACGGDVAEWEQRWRTIAAPPKPAGVAPYVGLQAFQREDADRFFGREQLTAKLAALVARRSFVGVFGASGSGKSSLLRAGLLPRLDHALVLTPGVRPVDECAVRLARLTGGSAVAVRADLADPAALGLLVEQHDRRLVLVVDQFEEVFTLAGPQERDWFVQALVRAPHVVIGVRADFYGHVGRHPELVEALEGGQFLVGPMTADELRRAITEPARHVGATVENALVTRLIADVAGEAAALPLVQHALAETWHRRRGMTLTLAGYEEVGGVEHAIARTAESVYAELSPARQRTARQIFLRLIAPGEGTEDTKRRALRDGLDASVLDRLATARLVTLSAQHAELTHEALIRSWPRLRDWVAASRNTLRVHHQLTEAAADWDGHDRDVLYKGARLAQAAELDADSLTAPERAFLRASQADDRRRGRLARMVVIVLAVLVVLLAGTVVFAVSKSEEAADRSEAAVAAAAAAQARWLLNSGDLEQGRAIRVALAAYRVAATAESRDVLLSADALMRRRDLSATPGATARFDKVVGGRFYVRGTDGAGTELWDVRANRTEPDLTLPGRPLRMSDDDQRVIVSGGQGAELLDVTDPAHPRKLADLPVSGFTATANGSLDVLADLVPDARRGRAPKVWLRDGGSWREVAVPGDREAIGVRLSPDGRTLVVKGLDGFWELWRLDGGEARLMSQTVMGVWPTAYEFSRDGRFLVQVGSNLATAQVWDVSDPARPSRWANFPLPSANDTTMVEFSADSRRVLVASDRSAHVWDLTRQYRPERIAAFEDFPEDVTAVDHWPATDEFAVVVRGETVWPLRTDLGQVVRDQCRGYAALSAQEWMTYFPDIAQRPVC